MSIDLSMVLAETGLARYLFQIRRFPMLEPQEEYILGKRWREHAIRRLRKNSLPRIFASSPRWPWAIAVMVCPSANSFPKVISDLCKQSSALIPSAASAFLLMRCGGFRA